MSEAAVEEQKPNGAPAPEPQVVLSVLTAQQALESWHLIGPVLETLMPRAQDRFDLEDLHQGIEEQRILSLVVWAPEQKHIHAVLLAEAMHYPKLDVFNVTACAGRDLEEWGHLWPALCQVGKQLGFDQIRVVGRAGWKKILTGATEVGRVFTKELNDAG